MPSQNKNSDCLDLQPGEGNQEAKISSSNEEQTTNQQIEVILAQQIIWVKDILQNLQVLNEGISQLLETQSILIKDITDLKLRFDEQ